MNKSRFGVTAILAGMVLLVLGTTSAAAEPFLLASETTWGGAGTDIADGVAIAPDGSNYVVGSTSSFRGTFEIFVLKFAPNATLAWQRTWRGPDVFGNDEGRAVAIAPDGSAVYVVGRTTAGAGDAVLLKFGADGTLIWQRTWGGSGTESGEAVAVASDGNVYVAGSTTTFVVPFLLKFDPNGNLVWQKGGSLSGSAEGVAVGPDGNIYVAGTSARSGGTGSDIFVLKVTPDAGVVWQATYSAGDATDDRGGIAVGHDNSIYVAGALQIPTATIVDLRALLLKLNPDGSLAWQRTWGGRSGDAALGVAVAPDGTALLAGSSSSFGSGPSDAFLVKFLPTGRATDAATWGGADLDSGRAVAVASTGTITLVGAASAPPYVFQAAPTRIQRPRGSIVTSTGTMTNLAGTVATPAGTVATPNSSLTFAGGFDAALIRVLP